VRDATISGWVRGLVVFKGIPPDEEAEGEENGEGSREQEEEVHIKVKTDKDAEVVKLPIRAAGYAPAKTYTDDWDWRMQLEQGDLVDCMDNEKDWYKSTVLATRWSKNPDGEDIKEVCIGFRVYDEEGSKTDDENRRFFGWSEKYDEWFAVTEIQVQRFNSIHQQYVKVESQNRQYCKGVFDFDDRLDPISSNKLPAFFAARRKSYFNASFVIEDSLNTFGHSGGFYKILDFLQSAARGEV